MRLAHSSAPFIIFAPTSPAGLNAAPRFFHDGRGHSLWPRPGRAIHTHNSISRRHACYQYSLPPGKPTTNFPSNHHRLAVNIRKVFLFYSVYKGDFARERRPWCTVKLVSLPLEHSSQPIILVENFLFMALKSKKDELDDDGENRRVHWSGVRIITK
jgi:hypothetical protein